MNNLEKITDQAVAKTGITNLQKIYEGHYYATNSPRNIIYTCDYQGKQAVLKAYEDPRESYEPTNLQLFHEHNRSNIIHAPELYDHQEIDSQRGWLIMEKLPENAKRFEQEMSDHERQIFLELFLEYRQNFPTEAPREVSLAENLTSSNFHVFRLSRWLELASKADGNYFLQTGQHFYDPQILTRKFQTSVSFIREVFIDRPMLWSHGHFKNHELFAIGGGQYYILDFAHSHLFPQGYELAFIIWADYMQSDNWQKLTTNQWLEGIKQWLKICLPIAKKLKYPEPEKLLHGAILERAWGSILADVIASDKSLEEKQTRLKQLFALVDYCLQKI